MADEVGSGAGRTSKFGSCCAELKEALAGEDFDPLITENEDGILYMAVGLIDLDNEEPGMVDHPIFFCPFCGSKLQTAEEVKAKVEQDPVVSGD
jgi:hypothetical protein